MAEAILSAPSPRERLPMGGLLALATGAFITILTEALPAGLLPQMGAGLKVSPSLVGQLVTAYALGTLLTAMPLTHATRGWRRRPLLLAAIGGFAVVNVITALSPWYALTLAARALAGVFAGVLWSLTAGYASRLVTPSLQGRAIAVAMVGTPLALSLGIPAGTWIGATLGWRLTFGLVTVLSLGLWCWVRAVVPDFPGQAAQARAPLANVFAKPGVRPVLFVTLLYVFAHNALYTYIAPFAQRAGLASQIDTLLLAFGVSAIVSIWIVGVLIDRWLRRMTLASIALFGVAAVVLGVLGMSPVAVYVGVVLWGLAFGGAATLFQTASAIAAGNEADAAQSMIVTVWNIAIAAGGIVGGAMLNASGPAGLPWLVAIVLVPTAVIALRAKAHGFR